MALILFAFSVAIYSTAKGVKAEVAHASVAVIDADHSCTVTTLWDGIQPLLHAPSTSTGAMRRPLDRGRDFHH